MKTVIQCEVNGEPRDALADPRDTLLQLLRDRLGLNGLHRKRPSQSAAGPRAGFASRS